MSSHSPVPASARPVQKPIRVDGKLLVVRSGAVLPQFCVKTNQHVSASEYKQRRIKWTKETSGRGLIKIISYFTSRQFCELTFGLKSGWQTRARIILALKIVVMLLGWIGMFVMAAVFPDPAAILGCLAVGTIAAILLPFGNSPVAIVRENNGEFWLKGCNPKFLSRFKA
jgi:hypothetical protein